MEPSRITFEQSAFANDWRYYPAVGESVEICNSEFREYVHIPIEIREVTIVFTENKPEGVDSFEFTHQMIPTDDGEKEQIGIITEGNIAWYDNTRRFMAELYTQGYRYATVEY